MRISRKLRIVLTGVAVLLAGVAIRYVVPTSYDPVKVYPIVRDVHEPPKRLELTPFPNGFLIEILSADDRVTSILLEFWNTSANGESGNWHTLQIRSDPNGKSERVEEEFSDTSLVLANLVNRYAKPGNKRDETLFYLTEGKKYRGTGALRAVMRKMGGT